MIGLQHDLQFVLGGSQEAAQNSALIKVLLEQLGDNLVAHEGTDLCFNSAYHQLMDGQKEAINQSFGNQLRSLVNGKHGEFTYNSLHDIRTQKSPFEIVYGSNPTNVLNLVPI